VSTDFKPGQLIDLEGVAQYLGQPLGSVRRWIHHPPEGFPQVVRLGTKIVVRFSQLERWATEPTMAEESVTEEPKRRSSRRAESEYERWTGRSTTRTPMPKRKLNKTAAQIAAEAQAERERPTSGGRSDKPRMPKRKLERTSAQILADAQREASK